MVGRALLRVGGLGAIVALSLADQTPEALAILVPAVIALALERKDNRHGP